MVANLNKHRGAVRDKINPTALTLDKTGKDESPVPSSRKPTDDTSERRGADPGGHANVLPPLS